MCALYLKSKMVPACREAGGITSFSSLLRHGKELHRDLLHCVLHALQALALDEASSVQMLQTGALSSCPKLLELQEDPVSSVGGHQGGTAASEGRRRSRLRGAASEQVLQTGELLELQGCP